MVVFGVAVVVVVVRVEVCACVRAASFSKQMYSIIMSSPLSDVVAVVSCFASGS